MATKLVIVESPAKAKTIGSYLGPDYEVLASIGHIRDLPLNSRGLPPDLKKKWWADFAVDIDNGFEPFYEVPAEKAAQVSKLRASMKGKQTLVLATDEDREGESISWHLLEVLKPAKGVVVQRVAFHEITRDAIQEAFRNPRQIDKKLVEAQETRRIVDRLYGYSLSPILWSRVAKNLSAGRVQSPAVKLIVEREEARRRFVTAGYWDLTVTLTTDRKESFGATLKLIDGQRIATGKDFDPDSGELAEKGKNQPLLLDGARAAKLAETCKSSKPWKVDSVDEKEGTERPAPPFMTTTLQQEANRKFGFSADRTMRIAQTLYEGVSIGGEQVGLITYMRTDSLALSGESISRLRQVINEEYPDCLPEKPVAYSSKVRNAQEAHEAIRPTDPGRKPKNIAKFLNEDQKKLYELIWKRTVACQMKPARVLRMEIGVAVKAEGEELIFGATGKRILFDGFRRAYMEGSDEVETEEGEGGLPKVTKGEEVAANGINAESHATKPPARYTDATLIKKLEEQGIGRPSTYASIISTIVDRGYVRKNGKQLVPTWRAFLSNTVLETGFNEFMELDFTAKMNNDLDEIAEGKLTAREYLSEFFLGSSERAGLKQAVEERKKDIPYPSFSIGNHPTLNVPIVIRNGKDGGAFLQVETEDGTKQYGNIPEDLAPADLTMEKALELLEKRSAPAESIGFDPVTGRQLLVKFRQGYYLETERTEEELENKIKPRWISLPNGVDPKTLSQEELNFLCMLPKTIGKHPDTGQAIEFKLGKFGSYVECGTERRTVENWKLGETMDVDAALEVLAQPKFSRGGGAASPRSALAEFGELEGCAGPVKVLAGRFGPYVTDGETNATLPKGTEPTELTAEMAIELLANKRAAGPSMKKGRVVKRKASAKKAPAKSTTKKTAKKKS